jgi:hypothetical protein
MYEYKIKRIVTDEKEQLDALQDFFFKQIFKSEIIGEKIIFKVPKENVQMANIFMPKFEEILQKKVEVKETK